MVNPSGIFFSIHSDNLQAESLYLGNDESLLYWEDHRLGVIADLTYGQKIYSGWENLSEPNGLKLCNNPYQVYPKAEVSDTDGNVFLGFGQAFGEVSSVAAKGDSSTSCSPFELCEELRCDLRRQDSYRTRHYLLTSH